MALQLSTPHASQLYNVILGTHVLFWHFVTATRICDYHDTIGGRTRRPQGRGADFEEQARAEACRSATEKDGGTEEKGGEAAQRERGQGREEASGVVNQRNHPSCILYLYMCNKPKIPQTSSNTFIGRSVSQGERGKYVVDPRCTCLRRKRME